jgi:hypothetical protein
MSLRENWNILWFIGSFDENWVMKIVVSFAFILLVGVGCNSANNQHPSAQYEEKKTSLKDMEMDSPLKFLKAKGDFRNNLLNQTVVEGEIVNHATLVDYKNVQVQMIFKDKEGNTLSKEKQLWDDVVKAGHTATFKFKLSHVKDASSVVVDIVDAEVEK